MSDPAEQDALGVAADPTADPAALADIAYRFPAARAVVAANPAAYDGLVDWLAALGDPAVDVAVAARRGTGLTSAGPMASAATATAAEDVTPAAAPVGGPGVGAPQFLPLVSVSPRPRRTRIVVGSVGIAVVLAGAIVAGAFAFTAPRGTGGADSPRAAAADFSTVALDGDVPSGSSTRSLTLAWQDTPQSVGLDESWNVSALVRSEKAWVLSAAPQEDYTHANDMLIGVDSATGKKIWETAVTGPCAGVVSGGLVCIDGHGSDYSTTPADLHLDRVDIATGKLTKGPSFESLGFTDSTIGVSLDTTGSGVVLSVTGPTVNFISPTSFELARVGDDGISLDWKTEQVACDGGGGNWPTVARVRDGVLLLSTAYSHEVVDWETGGAVADLSCNEADFFGDSGVLISGSADRTSVSDSNSVADLISSGDGYAVDFSSSDEVPAVPIVYTAADDGAVSVSALSDDGGSTRWTRHDILPGDEKVGQVYGAYQDGRVVLLDAAGNLVAIDASTGDTLWTAEYPAYHLTSAGASYVAPSIVFGPGGSVLVSDIDLSAFNSGGEAEESTHAFDAVSGRSLTFPDDWTAFGSGSVGDGESVGLDVGPTSVLVGHAPTVASLTASTDGTGTAAVPSGTPECPSGFTPVSWSVVTDGYVLLCSGQGSYRAAVRIAGTAVTCTGAAFDASGLRLDCAGSRVVEVGGQGATVLVTVGSGSTIYPARTGWITGSGAPTGFGAGAPTIAGGCPSGSFLLSVSIWKGGWLYVCGTDATSPVSLAYSDGTSTGSSDSVTYADGRYCSTGSAVACASGTPAVVSIDDTQYSVEHNYFADSGSGGAGQGTGAYDVAAPKDTADDQVRYLEAILRKSTIGRAQAVGLVDHIASCTADPTDVQTAAALVANRQELLSAVASTPVDQIPSGAALLTKLTKTLDASLTADLGYQRAITDVATGDCDAAAQDMSGDPDLETRIGTLKKSFVSSWNSSIVGTYDSASTFESGEI